MQRVVLSLFVSLVFSSSLALASPTHGGPEFDPTDDFDATNAEPLSNLDDLIPASERAVLDATREANTLKLERFISESDRAAEVDLSFRDTPVKKQFGGTCTAFGLMAAMENVMDKSIELSERHFWSEYHHAACTAALKAATTSWGVVELKWWANSNRHPFTGYLDQPWYKLTQYEALDGDITKAIQSLDAGFPVYVGFSTPGDMYQPRPRPFHVSPNATHMGKSGHAVEIVGYRLDPSIPGGGEFLMKNSWGTDTFAGNDAPDRLKGYQWYPFNLCTKKGMYCEFWSIQGVNHD